MTRISKANDADRAEISGAEPGSYYFGPSQNLKAENLWTKKREKKGTNAKKLSEMAQVNARRIEEPKRRTMTEQEREEVLKKAQEKNKNAKRFDVSIKIKLKLKDAKRQSILKLIS